MPENSSIEKLTETGNQYPRNSLSPFSGERGDVLTQNNEYCLDGSLFTV